MSYSASCFRLFFFSNLGLPGTQKLYRKLLARKNGFQITNKTEKSGDIFFFWSLVCWMHHQEHKNHQSPQESRASKHFQTPLGVEPQKLAHPHFPLISPCLLFNTKDRKLKKKTTVQGLPGSRILPSNFSSGQSEEASALRERRFSADFSDKLGLPITHLFPSGSCQAFSRKRRVKEC